MLALAAAEKKVAGIRAALAHNAALLGIGVESPGETSLFSTNASAPLSALQYLELIESQDDISDYLGREGDDESRPRLGPDAPEAIRPMEEPMVSPLVGQLVAAHPDDSIGVQMESVLFPLGGEDAPAGEIPEEEMGQLEDSLALPEALSSFPEPIFSAAQAQDVLDGEHGMSSQARWRPAFEGVEALRSHIASLMAARKNQGQKIETEQVGSPQHTAGEYALFPGHEQFFLDPVQTAFFLHTTCDGLWDWRIAENTVYTSPRWGSLVPPHDTSGGGSPLEGILHSLEPLEPISLYHLFMELLNGSRGELNLTVRIKCSPHPWKWGLLRALCLQDEQGVPERVLVTLCDTTAQHELEHALQTTEGKFRALTDLSLDVMGRFDIYGTILYISPSISNYFPVMSESVVGKSVQVLGIGGDSDCLVETFRRVLEVRLPLQVECSLHSPLMGNIVVECRFWPEFDAEGDVVSVSVQVRDMTSARRVAENYQALFTSMADGFALFEHLYRAHEGASSCTAHDFALVDMNPAFARMMELDEEGVVGHRLDEVLGKDAQLLAEESLAPVIHYAKPVLASFMCGERPIFVEISSYSPEAGRVACIVKDVTAMHEMLQEVRLNEARFAALYRLSHMDDAPEEEVIQFSLDQAVRLTGSGIGFLYMAQGNKVKASDTYWSHEVITMYEDEPLPALPKLLAPGQEHELDGQPFFRAVINNGHEAGPNAFFSSRLPAYRYILAPVIEDGRVVCIAGVANKRGRYEDSDLRQLELFINGMWFQLRRRWAVQTLHKAKDEAEAANRAKNEFLANVSHELRTPLNGILGMLQLLQQSSLTPEQLENVVTANYSGRSLLRIISDILDFSRIEAGRFVLEPQPFDLSATIRATLGMFVHQAEQKNLRFSLRISNDIPRLLLGDDARIRQIIFNLVGNAFKFTESGEIIVECSLLPRCAKNAYCIYLAVKDTGIGIPDDRLSDIFDAFTQLDGSSTRRYAGTGLGLSIVQRLVQMMDGSLTVESVMGEGTTIHCSLPLGAANAPSDTQDSSEETSQLGRKLIILVAEDDPINRLTIRSLLKKEGHTVLCVNDGMQALEALRLYPFDCLITDIQMPVMDGVEAAQRIRAGNVEDIQPSSAMQGLVQNELGELQPQVVPRDMILVALTAHAMTGDKEHFMAIGLDHYLAKPILVKELKAVLAKVGGAIHEKQKI